MASSSKQAQIESLAAVIMGHEGLEGLREQVQKKLFDCFRTSNPEEREVINAIMDNEALFFKEVDQILIKLEAEKSVNEDEE